MPYQLVNWWRQATHTEHLRRRRVTDNGPALACYEDVAIYIKRSMKCGFDLHHHVWWPSQVILGEPHRKMQCTVTGYRNWYKDCGHCGVTTTWNLTTAPREVVNDATMTDIDVSISVLSYQAKSMTKCSKLSENCFNCSMVTCAQFAIVPWGQVTWLFSLVTGVAITLISQQGLWH